MQQFIESHKLHHIIPLTIGLFILLGYQFIGAQWTNPPSNPPNGNTPAPINVGSSDQIKEGGLSVSTLGVEDGIAFSFRNTSTNPETWTGWRVLRNDGTGNFVTYLNSLGGESATYETTGHAFREQFNPGNGKYQFQTSQAGNAGEQIAWEDAFQILPGGKVAANEYCDQNGNNCTAPSASSCVEVQYVRTVVMPHQSKTTPTIPCSVSDSNYYQCIDDYCARRFGGWRGEYEAGMTSWGNPDLGIVSCEYIDTASSCGPPANTGGY